MSAVVDLAVHRVADVPLAEAERHAPAWAAPTRTTLTGVGTGGVLVAFESVPAVVSVGGFDGDQVHEVAVSVLVEDYYDRTGGDVEHSRDAYVRAGGTLLSVGQARALAVELLAAVNDAADAAGVL